MLHSAAVQELEKGLLWVVEQLPGMVQAADMTEVLERGYWPSYNVAYFPQVGGIGWVGGCSRGGGVPVAQEGLELGEGQQGRAGPPQLVN